MNLNETINIQAHAKDTPVLGKQINIQGLPITIEHPRGSVRKLHDDKGNVVYKQHMHHNYGYFNNTKGRDGDEVDCFTGPMPNAAEVYVVHMKDMGPVPDEREDEDKCFIGFPSADAAKAAFLMHYPPNFYDGMTALPLATFQARMAKASQPYQKKKITAAKAGLYVCDKCGHSDPMEKEVACPKCGKGEMGWKSAKQFKAMQCGCSCQLKKAVRAATLLCPKCASKRIQLVAQMAQCRNCGHSFNPKTMKSGSADSFPFMPVASADKKIKAGGPGSGRRPGMGVPLDPATTGKVAHANLDTHLKSHGFRNVSNNAGGDSTYKHPSLGTVNVTRSGGWAHVTPGLGKATWGSFPKMPFGK